MRSAKERATKAETEVGLSRYQFEQDDDGAIALCLQRNWVPSMEKILAEEKFDYIRLKQISDWLSYFPHLKGYSSLIRSVQIYQASLLTGLEELINLESIGIDVVPKPPPNLAVFKKLKGANLYWHKSYATSLKLLPELATLAVTGFTEKTCAVFGEIKSLRILNLTQGGLASLEGIQSSPMDEIHLSHLRKLSDIGQVSSLNSLKRIWIENAPHITDLSPICNLEDLEIVYLYNCGGMSDLDWVRKLHKAKKLWLPIPVERLDWDILFPSRDLEMLAVRPPEGARCSEEEIRQIATRSGKSITKFTQGGTKKEPIYMLHLAGLD